MNLLLNHSRQMQNKWSQKHKPHSEKSCLSLKTHITDNIWHELETEVNNSRHNNTSRNTLNSQLDKNILNLQQLLFCLSAHCPDQLFSPMQTHTHTLFCDWAPEHLCSGRKDRFPHLKSFYQKQTQLPWALLQPCQRLMAGSRTGLAPPGFPPWAWGLLNSKQSLKTQPKPLGATSIL